MKLLKSIWAVAAGFLAVFILSLGTDQILHMSGVYPAWGVIMSNGLFALATSYRIIYTILGGFITAKLAPSKPMKHVWILAGIGLVMSVLGVVAAMTTELGPLWYPIMLLVTSVPCVWLGGKLRK